MMTTTLNRVIGRQYVIGCRAYCLEVPCGRLALLVVERATGKLAHLVVTMVDHGNVSRLVPASRAYPEGDAIRLLYTFDELRSLPSAVGMQPMAPDRLPFDRQDGITVTPYYGLGPSGPNLDLAAPEPVLKLRIGFEDHVPPGEVRIFPGHHVHASDGLVGHVRGVVVDPRQYLLTHVLIDENHSWRRKRVAIPMGAVRKVDADGVWVRLTKHEVKELPPVEVAEE
jgi:hypothetical protein